MISKQFIAQSIQSYGIAYNTRDPLVMKWADAHINGLLGVLPDEVGPQEQPESKPEVEASVEAFVPAKKRGRRKKA